MSEQLAVEILEIVEDDALKVSGIVRRVRDVVLAELEGNDDQYEEDEDDDQYEEDEDEGTDDLE